MKKTIQTTYTDQEFRQLIRDEVQSILNNISGMPVEPVTEGYLTVKTAADLLTMAPGSIYNLIAQNKIPYHKAGKKVLFKKSELQEWLLLGNNNG